MRRCVRVKHELNVIPPQEQASDHLPADSSPLILWEHRHRAHVRVERVVGDGAGEPNQAFVVEGDDATRRSADHPRESLPISSPMMPPDALEQVNKLVEIDVSCFVLVFDHQPSTSRRFGVDSSAHVASRGSAFREGRKALPPSAARLRSAFGCRRLIRRSVDKELAATSHFPSGGERSQTVEIGPASCDRWFRWIGGVATRARGAPPRGSRPRNASPTREP